MATPEGRPPLARATLSCHDWTGALSVCGAFGEASSYSVLSSLVIQSDIAQSSAVAREVRTMMVRTLAAQP